MSASSAGKVSPIVSLLRRVVDGHRQPERHRREALHLALGNAAQRRVLDQHRHVVHLEGADLERVEASQLQAAQPDLADTGAEGVGDRRHAARLRHLPRDGRLLGSGVEDEVGPAPAVDPALHDHLVLHQLEVDGVQAAGGVGVEGVGGAVLERLQEPDLRLGPQRLVTAVLVGQEIDVVGVRRGGLIVALQALEDGAGGVMELAVAGRGAQRRLHLVQGLFEARARGQRLGQAVAAARHVGRDRQRVAELAFRFVEQAGRPQGVGVHGDGLGVLGRVVAQRGGFLLRLLEFADQERGLHHADPRPQAQRRILGVGREAKRRAGLVEARLLVEQRGQLVLQLGVVARPAAFERETHRGAHDRDQ